MQLGEHKELLKKKTKKKQTTKSNQPKTFEQ